MFGLVGGVLLSTMFGNVKRNKKWKKTLILCSVTGEMWLMSLKWWSSKYNWQTVNHELTSSTSQMTLFMILCLLQHWRCWCSFSNFISNLPPSYGELKIAVRPTFSHIHARTQWIEQMWQTALYVRVCVLNGTHFDGNQFHRWRCCTRTCTHYTHNVKQ